MVKRISRDASDVEFWVRFLVGAQTNKVRMCPEARLGDVRPGIEDLASIFCDSLKQNIRKVYRNSMFR